MDLSIMICTWNNSSRLAITLASVSACHIPDNLKWELVLVNNNCTDDTDQVVQSFMDKLPLVYVHEPQQGLSRARNKGLEVSSGRLIVFTDDDVKPYAGWITAYWSAYQQKPTDFYFGGPVESEFEGPKPDEELVSLAPLSVRGLDYGPQARILAPHEYFIGPNWACPKEALSTTGGFDTQKGLDPSCGRIRVGEELDLMNRLQEEGWSPWYVPTARLIHLVPAQKCGLKHIGARIEAGWYDYTLSRANKNQSGQRSVISGVPRRMYKRAFILWLKWVLARVSGKKGYQEYIAWRRSLGAMRSRRELWRDFKRNTAKKTAKVVCV